MPVPGANGEVEMKPMTNVECRMTKEQNEAFTLIELLVVIGIIVVLMGLLFPAFRGAQDQAKKVQAKNDLTQIVTAVNAFYTEYGRYPTGSASTGSDVTFGGGGTGNDTLFNELRGLTASTVNVRKIVFVTLPDVKDANNPRAGIGTTTGLGQFFDPWGTSYNVRIDGDYDNEVDNPYSGAGSTKLRQGAIAWSWGKDKKQDSDPKAGDDVLSWQ